MKIKKDGSKQEIADKTPVSKSSRIQTPVHNDEKKVAELAKPIVKKINLRDFLKSPDDEIAKNLKIPKVVHEGNVPDKKSQEPKKNEGVNANVLEDIAEQDFVLSWDN